MAILAFLMRKEFWRKESAIGSTNPSSSLCVIRADPGGGRTKVFANEGEVAESGQPCFENGFDVENRTASMRTPAWEYGEFEWDYKLSAYNNILT